jgi:cytochrome c biogenesis protein ResB
MEDFHIDYQANGQPKQFTSQVVLNESGKESIDREIKVNKPLRHGGYQFFQASYGDAGSLVTGYVRDLGENQTTEPSQQQVYVPFKALESYQVSLTAVHQNVPEPVLVQDGQTNPATLNFGAAVDYILTPPTSAPLQLRAYVQHPYLFGIGDGDGNYSPVYLGVSLEDKEAWEIITSMQKSGVDSVKGGTAWLKQNAAEYLAAKPEGQRLKHALELLQTVNILQTLEVPALFVPIEINPRYYAQLMVTYDPGAWLFWLGCALLMLGVMLVLYTSFMQVWVVRLNGQTKIYARGNRSVQQFF